MLPVGASAAGSTRNAGEGNLVPQRSRVSRFGVRTRSGANRQPTRTSSAIKCTWLWRGRPSVRAGRVPVRDRRGPLGAPLRARAIEDQAFVVAAAQWGTWGHPAGSAGTTATAWSPTHGGTWWPRLPTGSGSPSRSWISLGWNRSGRSCRPCGTGGCSPPVEPVAPAEPAHPRSPSTL